MIPVALKHNTSNWILWPASNLGNKVNGTYTFNFMESTYSRCGFNGKIGSQDRESYPGYAYRTFSLSRPSDFTL